MFERLSSGMKRKSTRFCSVAVLMIVLAFCISTYAAAAEDGQAAELDQLLPLVGGALVEAGQGNWEEVQKHVDEASSKWEQLDPAATKLSADVDSAIAGSLKALSNIESDPDAAKASLSKLAKAINSYKKSMQSSEGVLTGKEAAISLLPLAEQLLVDVQAGDWTKANADYQEINKGWPSVEQAVRADNFSVYGGLETKMSMIRISIQADPPRAEQAVIETSSLIQYINDYKDGNIANTAKNTTLTVADQLAILDQALSDVLAGHYPEAAGQMEAFIVQWPAVEGEVQLRSASVYSNVEIRMAEVAGYLLSAPPAAEKAERLIVELQEQLKPMVAETRYTAWDAGMILLREGLEAILVLAALLAYLQRTGNSDKRKWVWSGVGVGLLLSGIMAFVLTYAIAQVSAGRSREAIEGVAGLLSVILMITVGNWLHNKSNMNNWIQFIGQKMGTALAKGSLWSLFAVACLAIFREGAETTIFYVGMAPSIDPLQLALGFGVTFVLLIALGFGIIKFSAKLPVRLFFLVASVLIYYLVVRFLGESVHSLQVGGWLPAHSSSSLPALGALGVYPTWETTIPQLAVVAYIICKVCWTQLRKPAPANGFVGVK